MAWPAEPLPIVTEFKIDGTWTDAYSDRVRANGRITIARGASDQQSSLAPQTSDFTLNSRDGLFSNRNPLSPLYGKFGRNTQVRHSVLNEAGNLDAYFLKLWQSGGTWFSTADKAVLDITGDLDVRFEITPSTWRPTLAQVIGGKYNGSQRSWLVTLMPTGQIRFYWSPDGVAVEGAISAFGFGATTGRYAVRCVLDVNNGGGGRDILFYWATSLAGPWTLLGTNSGAGVTSIFNSTAAVEVGGANGNGSSPFGGEIGLIGKVHGAEIYQGIAGTLRAKFDPTTQPLGATSWSDGLGTPNTWTLNGTNGRITSDRVRFTGEISSIPQEWDVTGRDVWLPIRASGPLRRLMQGGQPIHSAIYRNLIQSPSINGYWPMEAGSSARHPDSAVPNSTQSGANANFSGSVPEGLLGSAGRVSLNSDGRIYMNCPGRSSTGEATFMVYFKLAAAPASEKVLMAVIGNGTVGRVDISVSATTYSFSAYSPGGTLLNTQSSLHGTGASPIGQWIGLGITMFTTGANINWEIMWHAVGTDIFYTPAGGGVLFAGAVGRMNIIRLDARQDAAFASAEFAHALISSAVIPLNTSEYQDSSKGYSDERAGTRLLRLAAEEGVLLDMYGDATDTEAMGAQRPGKLLDLWQDCAGVDGGALAESRDALGLQYVTRRWLSDQDAVRLDYGNSDLAETPKPIDDDRWLINDVTATRPDGSNVRATLETGPLSVQEPPLGVSRYEGTISKNAADDDQLLHLAEWEVFWRTWDEARVPNVVVGLHRTPFSSSAYRTSAMLDVGIGSPLTVTDLPAFLPPNDMRLLSFGYSEVLEQFAWTLTFNTMPFGPYGGARVDAGAGAEDEPRMSASIEFPTVLNASVTTSAVSIVINTPQALPRWANSTAHAAELPYDANLGGERVTVTACTVGSLVGANWQQTLTVTRSVNGIVKAHSANAMIDIWDLAYLQLGA